MRERIANGILLLTVGCLMALSYAFAARHNRAVPPAAEPERVAAPTEPPASIDAQMSAPEAALSDPGKTREHGKLVYARERCATCHSIAGEGNPRSPLDGVGSRRGADELEHWITAGGSAADLLSAGVARRKQRYRALSRDDLHALVTYLSTL